MGGERGGWGGARDAGGDEDRGPRRGAGLWGEDRRRPARRGCQDAGGDRGLSRPQVQGAGAMSAPAGPPAGAPLLELDSVTAFYGDLQALFGVSLKVHAGEIVTLIGANGAGKTTILRVVSGMKRPGSGCVTFSGQDASRVPAHEMVGRGVSHVQEGRQVFPFMTVRENL